MFIKRWLTLLLLGFLIAGCSGSNDETLTMLPSPAAGGSQLPFLASDSQGSTFLSWVEPVSGSEQFNLLYAKLNDKEWSKPQTIATSSNWFVNWADYPSIISQDDEVIAAHALKKIPGNTYSYNVNIYRRTQNEQWSDPITPHFDRTATEHGFVSMVPWENKILAIWLDGRRSHNRSDDEYFNINKAMTLRSALIGKNGAVTQRKLVDPSVCDCCNTSLALTSKGAIAAYRNRTDNEIRDIYISRYMNGAWSSPKPVHNDGWKIAACPVNGPAVAAADSMVVVAWYTATNEKPRVKAALSTDFGQHFSKPIIISNKKPLGRVDAVIKYDGNAFVSWIEDTGEKAQLKLRQIQSDGETSPTVSITGMNPSRASGFPQMEWDGSRLIFAWTDADSSTAVKAATVSVN